MVTSPCGSSVSDVPGGSSSSNDNQSTDNLVSNSKEGKSSVWTYFGYETNSQQATEGKRPDAVTCRLCKKSVIAKGGNTSNMLSHLKCHHPLQHSEARAALAAKLKYKKQGQNKACSSDSTQYKQMTVQEALKPRYSQQSKKWQQLTDSVTYCLAKDMMPIYSVEKKVSRNCSSPLTPNMNCPVINIFQRLQYLNYMIRNVKRLQQNLKMLTISQQLLICGLATRCSDACLLCGIQVP